MEWLKRRKNGMVEERKSDEREGRIWNEKIFIDIWRFLVRRRVISNIICFEAASQLSKFPVKFFSSFIISLKR